MDGSGPGNGPAALGGRRRVHPDHDQSRRLGRPFLPGGHAGQGHHRLLGQQLPVLCAQPHIQGRLRVGGSGARALVHPDHGPASGGGGPGPSRRGDRFHRRLGPCRQLNFATVDSPFGPVGLVAPLVPDVALCHAAVSDRHGNLAISEPMLEGVWGAWAARRGVVATVERIVDDLDGLGHRVRIPAHRVLAVVEAPFGAHPGGCYAPAFRPTPTARTFPSGSTPPPPPGPTSTGGPGRISSIRRTNRPTWPASGTDDSTTCGPCPTLIRGVGMRRPTPFPRTNR